MSNGTTYIYSIQSGDLFEIGQCVFLTATQQINRTPKASSNGGAAISVPVGTVVNFTLLADDIQQRLTDVANSTGTDPTLAISQKAATDAIAATVQNLLTSSALTAPTQGAALYGINPLLYFGYQGDGASHPLSSVTLCQGQNTSNWPLTQWQTLFPRALALTEQIDRHAIQLFCDLNPSQVHLRLPAGKPLIDKGILTGGNQSVRIIGAGRDLTQIQYSETNGTFWIHGYAGNLANDTFTVEDVCLQVSTTANAGFDTGFSGNQPPWCHIMRNVLIQPVTTGQYFRNAIIVRNYKRGVDWQNVVAYGAYFQVMTTDAFYFPANTDNTPAGDSVNLNNCMAVGYRYAVSYDSTGFTSSTTHCHEEGQFYNLQAYAGVGLLQYLNANYNFAPDDNFTLTACGWQGTGPALNLQYVEEVRMRDTLLVNDTVSTATDCFGHIVDCDSVLIDQNEIFSPSGSNITGFRISGSRTRNVFINRTDIVAYSSWAQFLYIDATVTAGGVEERGTRFAGSATFANHKINDQSGLAVSETRAAEFAAIASNTPPIAGTASIEVTNGGDIRWRGTITATTDTSGNILLNFPSGLLRSAKTVYASNANGNKTTSWVVVSSYSNGGTIVRYPQIASATSVDTLIEVIGN